MRYPLAIVTLTLSSCTPARLEVREISSGRIIATAERSSDSSRAGIHIDPRGLVGAVRLRGTICSVEIGEDHRYYISRDCRYRWEGSTLCFERTRFVDLLGDIAGEPKTIELAGCTQVRTGTGSDLLVDDLIVADEVDNKGAGEVTLIQYKMTPDVKSGFVCFRVSLEPGCDLLFAEISDPSPDAFRYLGSGQWDICYPHDWCHDPALRFTIADTCGRWSSPLISLSGWSLHDCTNAPPQTDACTTAE